ncbi:SDR family oxidoreductase [Allobranchiibius sp. GilTou38]|uniref:NAD-dependent epimerase/dehydratase family protein n=1 Tax=Allobranchiibius sp. GilTou38 TaxID=2815210 RepID=UPI001AA0C041|nr:SDR family oxidoreductase [Allobranchiibius sp. GilTou38]MBO1767325.1 SDR family oxidoreductase [Allobranchiibius sp. GilTou38]
MRLLVTGNQGYLGSVMVPLLQAAGHDVVGYDTGLYADRVLGPAPTDPPTIAKDIRDVAPGDLEGFEAVIHLAALSNDPLGALEPQITHDINHHASVRLAKAAKEAGVRRFLYASTCSVYGAAGADAVTEDSPMRPVTPYAESKVRVESDVHDLADGEFEPVFLRNATAFGASPRLRADIVLNNLVGHAMLSGRVLVMSDGTPWRPLVHARDIAEAFSRCLTAPREAVHAMAFNVGAEMNNATVAQIAQEAQRAVPGSELDITGETGSDPRSYRVDFSAIRAALPGYEATWSIADGARELAAAYRSAPLTREGFDGDFVRLAVLQRKQEAGLLDADFRPR